MDRFRIIIYLIFSRKLMSIIIMQQLALQIHTFKNIRMINQGSYYLRFHLYYRDLENNKIILSTPIAIIQNQKQKRLNVKKSQISDSMYISPEMPLKFQEQTLEINQICIFRTSIDTSIMYENIKLTLYCELLLHQPFYKQDDQFRKCCVFEADIKNSHCSQFLEITFDQKYCCIIRGSVHSISYKCEFKSNQQKVLNKRKLALEKKAKMHIKSVEQEIMQEQTIYHNLQQYIKLTPKKETEKMLSYYLDLITEQSIYIQTTYRYYLKLIQENKIKITGQQIQSFKRVLEQEKGRKKIFQNSSTMRHFQTKMHKLGNKIYHIWGNFIQMLNKITIILLEILQKKYDLKIREKYGECLIRHEIKGDWTVEKYEDNGQDHQLMATKIRNTVQQDQVGLNLIDKSIFPNPKFKPIIFQEIYIKPYNNQQGEIAKIKTGHKRLFIFVHGFGACRYDMQMMTLQIKKNFQDIQCFISSANQGKTQSDINLLGERLANQVIDLMKNYEKANKQILNISFVGHSMGGVIIRAALPKLQQFKNKFSVYISLSSPHVGYLYNPSKLIDAGLWIINNVQKAQSILQLTMQQNKKIEETFIYKLSKQKGFQWFSKIAFVSSYQDSYIPFQSARVSKIKKTLNDELNGSQKGKRYNEMVDNLILRIKASKLYRIDINFLIPQKNINNLIGRAAHLHFIECRQFIRMFITTCEHLFL